MGMTKCLVGHYSLGETVLSDIPLEPTLPVAPQLTVVPAPPLREAFERMRRTPTVLGGVQRGGGT